MWIEVDKNTGFVIGQHSGQCQSPNLWIEWTDSMGIMPNPGDYYKDGKVIRAEDMVPEKVKRQREAARQINTVYPVWKQMNIMREGDPVKIAEMSKFIDDVRAWSNEVK